MSRPWITISFAPATKGPLSIGERFAGWLTQVRYGDSGTPRHSRVVAAVIADNDIEVVPCALADTLDDEPDGENFVPYRIR